MDKVRILPFIFLFGISLSFTNGNAQNNYGSEGELKKEAERLFKEEEYSAANSLFSQLLSLYPKDPNYNFKYGVCVLMTGEDKEKPISYLEYASRSQDVDKEVFFFLGKAYHMNYRFDNAIAAYNSFKKTASKSQIEKLQVDAHILQCENGKKLLNNISDLYVLDKKELSESEYFRSYDLKEIGGKLLVKLDDFKTPYDKKKKENSVIYLSPQNKQIFYSSYGADGKNGKDIFMVNRLPNGEWSAPVNLGNSINTTYDEDYPFLHPNGKVLYFSSKGHNSMGGYDIFKSTLNEATNTWSAPVNVDFPISTPADDILYVTDVNEKIAYFSSNRSSENGKIAVYKIGVERKPVDVTIVSGNVKDTGSKGVKDAKITVKNIETGDLVGSYNTTVDGDYSIYLPGGGKYLYTIEAPDEKSRSEVVVIPEGNKVKQIKQEIAFTADDKISVKSSSDVSSEGYSSAVNLIKEKAKMEVNTSATAFEEQALINETKPVKTESENIQNDSTVENTSAKTENKLTNSDIINIAKEDAEYTSKEASELKEQAEQARQYADLKKKEADIKSEEVKAAEAALLSLPEGPERLTKQNEVNDLRDQVNKISKEAVTAHNIANKINKEAELKQQEADLSVKYAKELEAAVKSGNQEAIAKLDSQKEKLESLSQQQSTENGNAYSGIQAEAAYKQQELAKAEEQKILLQKEIDNIEKEVKNLTADAQKTKNEQLKEAINEQIKDLEQDKELRKKEYSENEIALVKLKEEAEILKTEAEVVSSMAVAKGGSAVVNTPDNNENKPVAVVEPKAVEPKKEEPVKTIVKQEEEKTFAVREENLKNEIEAVSAIEVNSEREQKLAEVYAKWAGEIIKEVDNYKKEMAVAKDDSYRSVLQLKIEKLEEQIKEKNTLAEASNKKAEDYKQAEAMALLKLATPVDSTSKDTNVKVLAANENKTVSTSDAVVYNKHFTEKLLKENVNGTELEKEQFKVEIYSNWVDSISTNIAAKKKEMANEPSTLGKEKIQNEITLLENELKDKNELLLFSQNKIKELQLPATAIAQKDTVQNKPIAAVEKDTVALATSVVVDTPSVADTLKKNNDVYAITETTGTDSKRVIAQLLEEEADDLRGQANRERSKAYTAATDVERDKLLEDAAVLDDKAKAKQFESAAIIASINKEEYDGNQAKLQEHKNTSVNNLSDEVALADAVAGEADYYFNEARKLRESALGLVSFSTRQDALESALEKEKLAIERQNKALEMYKKSYSENKPVAVESSTPSIVNNTEPVTTNTLVPTIVKTENNPDTSIVQTKPVITTNPLADTVSVAESTISKDTVLQPVAVVTKTDTVELKNSATSLSAITKDTIKSIETPVAAVDTKSIDDTSSTVGITKKEVPIRVSTTTVSTINPIGINTTEAIDEQEYQAIKNTREFKTYVALNSEADVTEREAKQEFANAESLKKQAEQHQATSKQLQDSLESTSSEVQKQALIEKIKYYNELAATNYSKADSVSRLANNSQKAAESKRKEALLVLQPLDDKTYNSVVTAANQSGIATPEKRNDNNVKPVVINIETPASSPDPAKPVVKNVVDKFEQINTPAYSSSRPIPIDEKLPDGLIYKVQIGAFRSPIPQDLFKGMTPITGETTPQGYTRYTAGIFSTVENANKARDEIRRLGYRDAFVVAFLNGKRVSLNQGIAAQPVAANQTAGTQDNTIQAAPIPSSNNLEQIKGLLYTVQVGVYSRPVTSSQLFNISPLFSERMPNGLIKYTSGLFNDLNKATIAKTTIVNIGIRDAFVTAYNDGKRTSIANAKKIEEGGASVFASHPDINKTPESAIGTPVNTNIPSDSPVVVGSAGSIAGETYYSIQIGLYRNEIPVDVANRFIQIASRYGGVKSNKDDSGVTIYSVGQFTSYDEAASLKQKIVEEGIADAFIISFKNGKKVPASR